MIPQVQDTLLTKLEAYLGCVCVPSNTTKEMPAYPFVSFTVINTNTKKGTYAEYLDDNGKKMLVIPALQTWSFTAQSGDEAEAMEKALMIVDFFAEAMRKELEDAGIIVADIGAITPRDNMLTIEYEYRKGLDVTLRLNNVIADPTTEHINKIMLTSNVGEVDIEKE